MLDALPVSSLINTSALWKSSKLKILEKSNTSTDSQGQPVYRAKIDLPTKLRLTSNNYVIDISIPVNSSPVVFLAVTDKHGKILPASGHDIASISELSVLRKEGYRYSFLVDQAAGRPLKITVSDEEGKVLGTEELPYKIISRGFIFAEDWL
jgi:hypothetical protein